MPTRRARRVGVTTQPLLANMLSAEGYGTSRSGHIAGSMLSCLADTRPRQHRAAIVDALSLILKLYS